MEDCYVEYGVREYAKNMGISPPTASKMLKYFEKESLLISRQYRTNILFKAKRDSNILKTLSVAYWQTKLEKLVKHISERFNYADVILFGSLIKLEAKGDSDIDLYVDAEFKEIDLSLFEKKLKRKIQLHFKSSLSNKNLTKNIEKGVKINGLG